MVGWPVAFTFLLLLGGQAVIESKLPGVGFPGAGANEVLAAGLPPELLRCLSLGQLPAVVDLFWIRALQATDVVAKKHAQADGLSKLYREMDTVTELDPAYFEAYESGAVLLNVASKDPTGALKLTEKGVNFERGGLAAYPDSFQKAKWSRRWNLHVLKAYFNMFEVGDMVQASSALMAAAHYTDSPEYLKGYAERLAKPDGQYEVGLRLLNHLMQSAHDDSIRARFEVQRRSLFVGQYLFNLNRDFRAFLDKMPEYRTSATLASDRLNEFWLSYRDERDLKEPWGGTLELQLPAGRIVSTTPHEKVLGLD